jgi:hypothetical protein
MAGEPTGERICGAKASALSHFGTCDHTSKHREPGTRLPKTGRREGETRRLVPAGSEAHPTDLCRSEFERATIVWAFGQSVGVR